MTFVYHVIGDPRTGTPADVGKVMNILGKYGVNATTTTGSYDIETDTEIGLDAMRQIIDSWQGVELRKGL